MVVLVIAVAVRLIFVVLAPIMVYLAVGAIAYGIFAAVSWWRNRW